MIQSSQVTLLFMDPLAIVSLVLISQHVVMFNLILFYKSSLDNPINIIQLKYAMWNVFGDWVKLT